MNQPNRNPNPTLTDIDTALRQLAAEEHELAARQAYWLARANRMRLHEAFGYASMTEYVERVFGYSPRMARERLRVAVALGDLPCLAESLAAGELSWSACREITRIAVPDNENEWIEVATQATNVREIEQMVSGLQPGDLPTNIPEPGAHPRRLVFEVHGETAALFNEAKRVLTRRTGHSLTDDDLLQLLARNSLEGPADDGRASYQVAVAVCERCDRMYQNAASTEVEVSPAAAEAIQCDAQVLDPRGSSPNRASQTIPPRVRRNVAIRDKHRCAVPGCRNAVFLDAHHIELRSEGGGNTEDNLVLVCSVHHAAIHEGRLIATRRDGRPHFAHADGTPYGQPSTHVGRAKLLADAFLALTTLGYRQGEARAALATIADDAITLDDVVRGALRTLAPRMVSVDYSAGSVPR